jgi:hypothetical protein
MQLITTEATPSFGEVTTQQLELSGPELAACNSHGGAMASILKYVQMVLGKSDRFHEVEWQLHLGDIDGLQGRLEKAPARSHAYRHWRFIRGGQETGTTPDRR